MSVGYIGMLLQAYRDVCGLSVRDLSDELKLSPATISRIENGHPCDQRSMVILINWLFSELRK